MIHLLRWAGIGVGIWLFWFLASPPTNYLRRPNKANKVFMFK